jgi:hypothetical protein
MKLFNGYINGLLQKIDRLNRAKAAGLELVANPFDFDEQGAGDVIFPGSYIDAVTDLEIAVSVLIIEIFGALGLWKEGE